MIDDPAEQFKKQLEDALGKGNGPKAARFALACLGAIPGVGGAISGAAASWSEEEQAEYNRIFAAWLKLQEDEIRASLLRILRNFPAKHICYVLRDLAGGGMVAGDYARQTTSQAIPYQL